MIKQSLTAFLIACLVFPAAASNNEDAPTVVRMDPPNGSTDVDPDLSEIVIHFSEPMGEAYSVMKADGEFPKVTNFYFKDDSTAFVLEVRLRPETEYRFGINGPSPRHKGFKNREGVPVEPTELFFKTGSGDGPRKIDKSELPNLGKIDFSLLDANGFKVESADYEGVPLFITFGAAW